MISPAPVPVQKTWLLHAKYRAPKLSEHHVSRSRLLKLHGQGQTRVTTVIAPAGFGKTTLLAELHAGLKTRPSHVAWLTLDADDNDCSRFALYLISALLESGLPMGALAARTQNDLPAILPRDLLGAVLHHVESSRQDVHLLLDDVENLHDESALEFLRTLIKATPANLRIVIAGRRRPAVHLGELRANGLLSEIGLDGLRFTTAEAQALFGEDISDAQTATLVRNVEGWPVVLKLTLHWIREGRRLSHNFTQVVNQSEQLTQYLAEEIFTTLPPELADFLARISIHDRICGDLAYALTDHEDSGALLRQLAEENLLLLPIDSEPQWYRHHKFTLRFFRDRLQCQHTGEALNLHRKAAAWFSAHGLPECAIRHAELSQDRAYALQLTEASGGWRVTLREGGASLRALRALGAAPLSDYPKVQLGKVFAALQMGTVIEAREAFEALRRSTNDFHPDALPNTDDTFLFESRLIDNLLMYYEDRPMDLEQVESLNDAIAATPGIDPLVVAVRESALCCGYLDAGGYDRCREITTRVLGNFRDRNFRHVDYYMHLITGLSHLHQGQLTLAQPCLEASRDLASMAADDDGNVHLAFAEILLAELHCEQGELATARLLVDKSLPLIETTGGFLDVLASGYSTLISLAAHDGDAAAADAVLNRAQQVARRLRLDRLGELMSIRRVRERLRYGDVGAAARCWEALDPRLLRPLETVASRDLRICGTTRVTGARLLIALGQPRNALESLVALEPLLSQYGLHRLSMEAGMLKACCLYITGEIDAANAALKAAIQFACREGHHRLFESERPLLSDVAGVARNGQLASGRGEIAYLQKLIGDGADECATGAADTACERAKEKLLLSPRETEVIKCLADGLSNKEIAWQIGIAEGTVKVYRKSIYRKLDVRSRSGVIEKGRSLALL